MHFKTCSRKSKNPYGCCSCCFDKAVRNKNKIMQLSLLTLSATKVPGASSARFATSLTRAGISKRSQRCCVQQSLKLNSCNASVSPISVSKALKWQVNRGLYSAMEASSVLSLGWDCGGKQVAPEGNSPHLSVTTTSGWQDLLWEVPISVLTAKDPVRPAQCFQKASPLCLLPSARAGDSHPLCYYMNHAVWIEHNAMPLLQGQNETEVGKEARLLPSPLGSQPWSGDLARKPRCTRAGKYLSACATLLRKAREMLVWAAVTPSLARQVSGSCPRDGRLCFHHCTSVVCIDKGSKLLHAEESRKKLCWLYKNHHIPQLRPNYFLLIGLLLTVFSPQNTVDIYILLRHLLANIIERRDVRCKTMPSIRETSH